jgi:hypothetical protein
MMSSILSAQGLTGGLKIGLNPSNQKFKSDEASVTSAPRTSFHLGGYITAMVTERFGFQPELLYNRIGSKFDVGATEAVYKLNYLSVPALLRNNFGNVSSFQIGPQFNFLLNSKIEFDGNYQDIEDVKNLDLGLTIGTAFKLSKGLHASLPYTLGLSNISVDGSPSGERTMLFRFPLAAKYLAVMSDEY